MASVGQEASDYSQVDMQLEHEEPDEISKTDLSIRLIWALMCWIESQCACKELIMAASRP